MTRSSQSRGGGGATPVDQLFRRQAVHFTMLGSPVCGHLAGRPAEDPRPARAILGDGASWDLGLRLFRAVHYLGFAALVDFHGNWTDWLAA